MFWYLNKDWFIIIIIIIIKKINKWQFPGSMFYSANFSQNFTTCGSSFCFLSIFITLQAEHPFVYFFTEGASFNTLRVLSKIKYSYLNQNGESKMPVASKSFLNNNWRHHDVPVIVKGSLCFSRLLDMKWCHHLWKKEL